MCTRGRAHGFLLPVPFLLPDPSDSDEAFTASLSPRLSLPLSLRPRNVGENPRRLARAYFSVHTIIVEGARRWYRVRAGSSAPRKEALFLPPSSPCLTRPPPSLHLLLCRLFLLLPRRHRDGPATSDYNAFFFYSIDFLLSSPEQLWFPTGNLAGPALSWHGHLFSPPLSFFEKKRMRILQTSRIARSSRVLFDRIDLICSRF